MCSRAVGDSGELNQREDNMKIKPLIESTEDSCIIRVFRGDGKIVKILIEDSGRIEITAAESWKDDRQMKLFEYEVTSDTLPQ